MVKIPDSIMYIIKRYVEELKKNHIRVQKAFLFGSYATGAYDRWSDIDVALISDDFQEESLLDAEKIAKVTLKVDSRISPLTYKRDDFDESNLFVKEIQKNGIDIPLSSDNTGR